MTRLLLRHERFSDCFVRRVRTALLAAGCLVLAAPPAAAALDPLKQIGQYMRTVWETATGLPQNSVQAVLQTRDGYVWFGTQEGLVRFDGSRFDVFNRRNTPELPGNDVKALFEAPDGSLWIGTGRRAGAPAEGRFTSYTIQNGLTHDWIYAITGDRSGNLWLGTFGGGLLRFKDGKFTAITSHNGLPDDFVWAIRETRDGSLWVGTNGGLTRITGKDIVTYTTRDGLPDNHVNALWEDRAGALWIGTARGPGQARRRHVRDLHDRRRAAQQRRDLDLRGCGEQHLDRHQRGSEPARRARLRRLQRRRRVEPQSRRLPVRGSRGQPLDRHQRRRRHQADRSELLDVLDRGGALQRSREGRDAGAGWHALDRHAGRRSQPREGRSGRLRLHDARRSSGGHRVRPARAGRRQHADRDRRRAGASSRAGESRRSGRTTSTATRSGPSTSTTTARCGSALEARA